MARVESTNSAQKSSGFITRVVQWVQYPFLFVLRRLELINDDHYRIRGLYDFGISTLTSAVAWVFCRYFIETRSNFQLFVGPLLLTGLIAMFGLYSRIKEPNLLSKVFYLVSSLLISSICCYILGANITIVSLWFCLTLFPILIPRTFASIRGKEVNTTLEAALVNRGPILVVGGAGFIGSHLVEQLLKKGARVRVLDKLMYGKESLKEYFGNPHFSLVEGDATDLTKLLSAMKGASAVVHLGGLVGDPACSINEQFTTQANIIATRMLKDAAIALGIPRFIFASSCSVYGTAEDIVSETSDLNPVSLYAKTKIDSERELLGDYDHDFICTVLRFATVYGHSRRPRFDLVANLFTAQALKEGEITVTGSNQWRPFLHARDIAKTIVAVIEAPRQKVQGQIFNVGSSEQNMTIDELAMLVKKMVTPYVDLKVNIKNNVDDRRNYRVSFDKIWNTLPLERFTTMEFGIQEMIENHLSGTYRDYKDDVYSNVATTRKSYEEFSSSDTSHGLYGPLKVDRPKIGLVGER